MLLVRFSEYSSKVVSELIHLVGGGAFAVIPLGERGKLPDLIPLFKGHSGPVLDTDFNPFNDSVLASASEDGKVSRS
jgi:WD40 repeat protein